MSNQIKCTIIQKTAYTLEGEEVTYTYKIENRIPGYKLNDMSIEQLEAYKKDMDDNLLAFRLVDDASPHKQAAKELVFDLQCTATSVANTLAKKRLEKESKTPEEQEQYECKAAMKSAAKFLVKIEQKQLDRVRKAQGGEDKPEAKKPRTSGPVEDEDEPEAKKPRASSPELDQDKEWAKHHDKFCGLQSRF